VRVYDNKLKMVQPDGAATMEQNNASPRSGRLRPRMRGESAIAHQRLSVTHNQAYTHDGLHRLKTLNDESMAAEDRYWEPVKFFVSRYPAHC